MRMDSTGQKEMFMATEYKIKLVVSVDTDTLVIRYGFVTHVNSRFRR